MMKLYNPGHVPWLESQLIYHALPRSRHPRIPARGGWRSGLSGRPSAFLSVGGGLIRAIVEIKEGRIAEVSLSGDFFFYPADKLEALEADLAGVKSGAVEPTIAEFYRREGIESPGVTPSDFARVLAGQGA